MSSTAPFGVYLHVPFCRRRCDYCAFATWTDRHHLIEPYVEACRRQLSGPEDAWPSPSPATSLFFGGGTPSQLGPDLLAALIDAVPRRPGAEVTLECNPDDVDRSYLEGCRDAGVTRLSLGVQSMVDHVLVALGREHDRSGVRRAAEAAGAAGFDGAYSVDLIYGGAGETLDDWRRSVVGVLDLDPAPAHVSAYGLTVEAGTPLALDRSRHPDPDDQADKYALADDLLGQAGLGWYEISNWSRPGAECAHNRLYWDQGDYRGVGCAAHSHAAREDGTARRWWNVRTPDRYIRLVGEGAPVEAAGEDLDAEARRSERLTLGLRTRQGVASAELDQGGLDEVVAAGLVTVADGRAVLTRAGRLLGTEVTLRTVP